MGKFYGKPKSPFTKELHEYTLSLSLPLSLNERTLLSLSLSTAACCFPTNCDIIIWLSSNKVSEEDFELQKAPVAEN